MSRTLKRIAPILSVALPIVFPGVGAALGAGLGFTTNAALAGNALLGAGLGAVGGGAKGAALGGLSGGLAGGGANALAGAANLGSSAATSGLSGALTGAGAGLAASGGDLSSALAGAATGGLGSYYSAGGFGDFLGGGSGLSGSLGPSTAATGTAGATAAGAAPSSGFLSGIGNPFGSAFDIDDALGGALRGGIGALASGGDLGEIALGGGIGGLGGGFGNSIGEGLNFSPEQTAGLRGFLTGGSGGLATGNTEAALLGGGIGGARSYFNAGGLDDIVGRSPDTVPQGAQGPVRPGTGLTGLTEDIGNQLGFGQTPQGGSKLNLGSLLSGAGDVYGYLSAESDLDDLNALYNRQAGLAQQQLQPFAQAGTDALARLNDPNALAQLQEDPGYQFQLQEGNRALNNFLNARGMRQSGEALRQAQEFGQGLADTTYNNFFNRNMRLANQGFGASQGLGSILTGLGDARARSRIAETNQRNKLISSLGSLFA